ncbi:MAG: YbjN domain-containing protein [Spirulina sp. SIO3F2]|nr:YbjN domain-containing protein [Spirulina sp. SIO3F2]
MHKLDRAFQFQTPNTLPLKSRIMGIDLIRKDKQVLACQLKLKLTVADHQRLQAEGLFGYQPELCTPLCNGDFDPQKPLTVHLTLDPDHLDQFADCTDAADASSKLLLMAKTAPLRRADNWYLQSVSQGRGQQKTGYRTFWDYLDLQQLNQEEPLENQLGQFISTFLAESTLSQQLAETLNLQDSKAHQTTQELTAAFLETLPGLLRQEHQSTAALSEAIADLWQTNLQQQLRDTAPALAANIENPTELAQDLEALFALPAARRPPLIEQVMAVFEAEGWAYERIDGQPMLRSLLESEVGQWLCLVEAQATRQQLCVYSIGRGVVPTDQRQDILQFFNTINYSAELLGRFELDLQDGEFRYRTGIDTRFISPNPAHLKVLLQDNMMIMERYLPSITQVILGELTLGAAIATIPTAHLQ